MKQKQHTKREYQTDFRIKATPHQAARSFFRNDASRQSGKRQVKDGEPE